MVTPPRHFYLNPYKNDKINFNSEIENVNKEKV